mmetsp:Transcript_15085/g.26260  ORF Transcript_15085/g.26260 Transcript_15085/m.26260 type:complete len:222 (+) Transcript_15085:327-992(+)
MHTVRIGLVHQSLFQKGSRSVRNHAVVYGHAFGQEVVRIGNTDIIRQVRACGFGPYEHSLPSRETLCIALSQSADLRFNNLALLDGFISKELGRTDHFEPFRQSHLPNSFIRSRNTFESTLHRLICGNRGAPINIHFFLFHFIQRLRIGRLNAAQRNQTLALPANSVCCVLSRQLVHSSDKPTALFTRILLGTEVCCRNRKTLLFACTPTEADTLLERLDL